jgi:hypothetical protein
MQFALFLLAVAGFLAVLKRLGEAAFRALKRGADAFILSEVASSRAQRGDITGLTEAQQMRRTTRRARWRAAGSVLLWVGALLAPLLTQLALWIYASYSLLWLVPPGRRRNAS